MTLTLWRHRVPVVGEIITTTHRYSPNRVMEQKSLEHEALNLDFLKLTDLEDRFAQQSLLL